MTWQVRTLADVGVFQRGLTYTKSDEVAESGNIVLRANNIDLTTNQLDLSELRHIRNEVGVPEAKKVREGSLLICTASGSKSHLGKVALIDHDYGYAFGGFMGQITPKAGLDSKYLFHLMTSNLYKEFIGGLSDGANINNLKFDDLGKFGVPLPSEIEQQRIVAILDEAFAGIATAKDNAEKNLQNARAVFDCCLQTTFSRRAEGWVEKALSDVFGTSTGTTPPKSCVSHYGDFMPLVKPPELCDEMLDSAADGLSKTGVAVARTLPAESILVSCIGNLGKIGFNTVPVAFNQQINAILPDTKKAIPAFMFYQALSSPFKTQLEALASGTTVPIVNKSKFNSVRIVLPALAVQESIVNLLDSLREETQHLESLYTRKLAALEALKQSLLHQAFSGQL